MAGLLRERAELLEAELAQASAAREHAQKQRVPRLFWVEGEFRAALREAELGYVRQLIREIESGSLDGANWWHAVHDSGGGPVPTPTPDGDLAGGEVM